MKTREHLLVNARTMADSETYTKDLPGNSKIMELRIRITATNGATSNTLAKHNAKVTKIEVVDGSDVLHSLSGQEEQANNFYRHGSLPFQQLNSKAAGVVIEEFIVSFGRFRGDREFYLDTSRWKNAQLRITHAFTVSATAGIATGTGVLTVIAKLIEDGAPPYKGFIMSKDLKSWTTLASGVETAVLPRDFPYQSLLVGDLETLIEPDVDLTNLKLIIDSGRWVPFDLSTPIILAENMQRYGRALQRMNYLNDTAVTWLSDCYGRTSAWAGAAGITGVGIVQTVIAEQVVLLMVTAGTSNCFINVSGYAPHSFLCLPFGDGMNIDDYLQVQGVSLIELEATQGAAGGAGAVVANQLRV